MMDPIGMRPLLARNLANFVILVGGDCGRITQSADEGTLCRHNLANERVSPLPGMSFRYAARVQRVAVDAMHRRLHRVSIGLETVDLPRSIRHPSLGFISFPLPCKS